jgi:hypothetical protein
MELRCIVIEELSALDDFYSPIYIGLGTYLYVQAKPIE